MYINCRNQLYPSVATNGKHPFPVGKPTCLINKQDLASIQLNDGVFSYLNESGKRTTFCGVLQVRVLAPPLLDPPFLPLRYEGKSLVALCRVCAEKRLTAPCAHSEDERAFVETYCSNELAYAVEKLNYKVLDIYEAVIYTKTANIFARFFKIFSSFRLRYSGWPSGCDTQEQKELFCLQMNAAMGFDEECLKIYPHMITYNTAQKDFWKTLLNRYVPLFVSLI